MENATMQTRNFSFLLSEASGRRSRSAGTIKSGSGILAAGTVLGLVTADSEYAPSANAEVVGNEGAEVAVAILGYGVDATTQAVEVTLIDNDAEAKRLMLTYDASVDDETKIAAKVAQLKTVGIRVR